MNFFERQRQVRRMSVRLVVLFVLAVIGIIIAIDLAVAFAFNAFSGQPSDLVSLLLVTSLHRGGRGRPSLAGPHRRPARRRCPGCPRAGRRVRAGRYHRSAAAPAAQRGRGDGDRGGRNGAGDLCPAGRDRDQRVRGRLVDVGRGGGGDPRCAGTAQPRRAARRDRPRVQPRCQRGHAAQHPAHRAAVRHLVPFHHRPDAAAGQLPGGRSRPGREIRGQQPATAHRHRAARRRRDRGARRSDHPGFGLAAARVSGRHLGGAVHPPDQRASPAR